MPSLVQEATGQQDGFATSNDLTATFGTSTTAGNLLTCWLGYASTFQGWVTYALPAGWVQVDAQGASTNDYKELWYYPNNPGGITAVVATHTEHTNVNNSSAGIQIQEWSGIATSSPLEHSAHNSETSSATPTVSTSSADAASGNLVLAGWSLQSGSSTTFTPSTGFSALTAVAPTNFGQNRFDAEWFVSTSATTQTSAPTYSGGHPNRGIIATFLPSSVVTIASTLAPAAFSLGTSLTYRETLAAGLTPAAFTLSTSGLTQAFISAALAPAAFSLAASSQIATYQITSGLHPAVFSLAVSGTAVRAPNIVFMSPHDCWVGQTPLVDIVGDNFASTVTVTFGAAGNGTSLSQLSSTEVTVLAPSYAGPATLVVDVMITVTSGAFNPANPAVDRFTFKGIPNITGVSPNSGGTTGGTTLLVTGDSFADVLSVAVGANPAASFSLINDNTMLVTSPPGSAGTVDVTATNPAGTSATGSPDHFTYLAPPTITSVSPNHGHASSTTAGIVITGTGFSTATAVKFGFAPAVSFHIDSSTQITAVAPAGSGTVDVRVQNPGGSSATSSSDLFTWKPSPIVTAVLPPYGPLAGGTAVTILGSLFATGATVKFGASSATSVVVVSATRITCVSPAGTGIVDVVVTSNGQDAVVSPADQFQYIAVPSHPLSGSFTAAPRFTGSLRSVPRFTGSLLSSSPRFTGSLVTSQLEP